MQNLHVKIYAATEDIQLKNGAKSIINTSKTLREIPVVSFHSRVYAD